MPEPSHVDKSKSAPNWVSVASLPVKSLIQECGPQASLLLLCSVVSSFLSIHSPHLFYLFWWTSAHGFHPQRMSYVSCWCFSVGLCVWWHCKLLCCDLTLSCSKGTFAESTGLLVWSVTSYFFFDFTPTHYLWLQIVCIKTDKAGIGKATGSCHS